jgi:hypothetical protein
MICRASFPGAHLRAERQGKVERRSAFSNHV